VSAKREVLSERFGRWLDAPQPALRLELIRIFAPLAILGFMSSRIRHAPEWLGSAGFRVPDLGESDYRQPLYIPALPDWAAWLVALALLVSGLAVSLGIRARTFAWVFACLLAFVALSDRLAAFTVSKLSPAVLVVLALSPCGRRLGVDAWLALKRGAEPERTVAGAHIRFFQVLLPVIYSASGIAKARGDWLERSDVLFTLMHDSYQTVVAWALANALPLAAWSVLQFVTLAFEALAPVWFASKKTRSIAFIVGVGMHATIGLSFGPVKWFSLLMISLLVGAYLPDRWLRRVERLAERIESARRPAAPTSAPPRRRRAKASRARRSI
jgi:uncharacterized membrane protein YphA (DoxX/SURF4 family)